MAFSNHLPFPTFSVPTLTQSSGTVITQLIPPYPGPNGSPGFLYTTDANWSMRWARGPEAAWTHVTSLVYTSGATQHTVSLMRPLNWTTMSSAAANGQTTINISDDPGIYSTNYKYPTPGGVVKGSQGGAVISQVADHGIAGNDYIAYQLADGTWFFDIVSSVSTLALTMTTNVPGGTSGVGALKGAVVFYFGVASLSDPATGIKNWSTTTTASQNRQQLFPDYLAGGFQTLHPGDPVLFYSPNGTNAGTLDYISGFYGRH